MARGYQEYINLIRGAALNVSGKTTFSDQLPMGEGWYFMNVRVGLVITIGTGSGAIAEGELLIIKNVYLKTDRGEIICNLPGRALYKIAIIKTGTTPRKNAIAAATATYYVNLPIYFVDYYLARPEDTILDTSRYSSVMLEINLGGVADLFTTVGTSSMTATIDVEVDRSKGLLPAQAKPRFFIEYDVRNPIDASVTTEVNLQRSPDLSIKRLYTHECSSGTAGQAWSGANADDVKDIVTVKDQTGDIVRGRPHEMIQDMNKQDYSLETVPAGVEVIDFVRDRSIHSALYTGNKSELKYSWTNKTVAAGDNVSVATESIRVLK
jgi:hypothetical protein